MTLQEAIDNDVFISGATQSYTTEIPNPGHSVDEIWISVNGNEMILQDALSISDGLCGSPPTTPYTNSINLGQFASEIEVSPNISFQDAIDNGDFCCIPETCASLGYNCGIADDGCGGTLSCGSCYPYLCQNNICSLICGTCIIYSPIPPASCGTTIVNPFPDACGCVGPQICCPPSCRMYAPPHPSWCSGGIIVGSPPDVCGCPRPPTCCPDPPSCPMYSPPAPDWCSGGTILPGIVDECGCVGHLRCV
jgi:hypothetical protein